MLESSPHRPESKLCISVQYSKWYPCNNELFLARSKRMLSANIGYIRSIGLRLIGSSIIWFSPDWFDHILSQVTKLELGLRRWPSLHRTLHGQGNSCIGVKVVPKLQFRNFGILVFFPSFGYKKFSPNHGQSPKQGNWRCNTHTMYCENWNISYLRWK